MEKNISNVVVVRFSIRVKAWRNRLFFDEKSRESWYKYRAELYRQTLGLSLNRQTEKPFRIYLFMDQGDRPLYEKYFNGVDFVPIFSDHDHSQMVADDLGKLGVTNNVAITRIDSDDIVECRFFEKINAKIRELKSDGKNVCLIGSSSGYRTNFLEIQSVFHGAPPFITLFSERYAGEDVYSHDHRDIGEMDHVKDTCAEWMQVIHGTNVANIFKPANTASLEKYLDGNIGSGFTPRKPIDGDWFKSWSGFDLPDPSLFREAPIVSARSRIRRFWRGLRGKT